MAIVMGTPHLVRELFTLVDAPVVGVRRSALELLFVMCGYAKESGFSSVHRAAKSIAMSANKGVYYTLTITHHYCHRSPSSPQLPSLTTTIITTTISTTNLLLLLLLHKPLLTRLHSNIAPESVMQPSNSSQSKAPKCTWVLATRKRL